MAILRPEFGPGLPELLAPRLRTSVRRVRAACVALAVVLVVALGLREVHTHRGSAGLPHDVFVTGATPFTLGYKDGLRRQRPDGGEELRLTTGPGVPLQSFVVSPLQLAPYRGDQAGVLPVLATRELGALRREFPTAFRYRGDGRARINLLPGHQVNFQARIDGHVVYGKRFFLLPDVDPPLQARTGVRITLLAQRSGSIPNLDAVGNNGLLKSPLRSFRFGTKRGGR